MRIKTFYTASDIKGEINTLDSMTVPDMSLSIKDIINRCDAGLMEMPKPLEDGYEHLMPEDVLPEFSDISEVWDEAEFFAEKAKQAPHQKDTPARSPINFGSSDSSVDVKTEDKAQ